MLKTHNDLLALGVARIRNVFLRKLIISLTLLAVIPTIVSSFIINIYYKRVLAENLNDVNTALLNGAMNSIDGKIRLIEAEIVSFYTSENAKRLLTRMDSQDYYYAYEICEYIKQVCSRHSILDNVLIYSNSSSYILTRAGTYDVDYYLGSFQSPAYAELLKTNQHFSYDFIPDYRSSFSSVLKAIFFSASYSTKPENIDIVFSAAIPERNILRELSGFDLLNTGKLVIISDNGMVLLSFGVNDYTEETDFITISVKSDVTGWTYKLSIPTGDVFSGVMEINSALIMFTAIVASIALLLSFYLVYRI